MKRLFLTLIIYLLAISAFSQELLPYDTIIDMKVYKSYYSYDIQGPAFCIYKLYKGGGDVSRKSMGFTSDLPHFDYSNTGYDRGHLVNAEDFAYDYESELATFKYYNCVPQSQHMNRGIWKRYETKIRKSSQTDSLLIICGGSDYAGLIPERCWKVAYSLKDRKRKYAIYVDQFGNEFCLKPEFLEKVSYEKVDSIYQLK